MIRGRMHRRRDDAAASFVSSFSCIVMVLEVWSFLLGAVMVIPRSDGLLPPLSTKKTLSIRQLYAPVELSNRHWASRIEDLQATVRSYENNPSLKDKLMSYLLNIQRERKAAVTKATRSFIKYLETNRLTKEEVQPSHVDLLERALTQALRLCGEIGDYRMAMQLVDKGVEYANGMPLLKPRVFGEALDALARTHANASKLKQVWNIAATENAPFLASPLTAYELNVMLKSLATRGNKAKACMDLYIEHTDPVIATSEQVAHIRPDAYTASTLFSVLTDSVNYSQPKETPRQLDNGIGSNASKLEREMKRLTYSDCWQWNGVVEILHTLRDPDQWNNHVYSALLKLQDRAQELMPQHENGPQLVTSILDSLISQGIRPDIVTCTLAMKGMGDPKSDPSSWKLAVGFLEELKRDSRLPNPNQYAYSAAIVACARCHEYSTALELLNQMRSGVDKDSGFQPPFPNTWVYNAVLSALAPPEDARAHGKSKKESSALSSRRDLAFRLLSQMKADNEDKELNTAPDTVTYNTILAICGTLPDSTMRILNEMKESNIARDLITYRNAVASCTQAELIIDLLKIAHDDLWGTSSKSPKSKAYMEKMRSEIVNLWNAALSTSSLQNNLKYFKEALQIMDELEIEADSATLGHLLRVFSRNGNVISVFETFTSSDVAEIEKTERLSSLLGISFAPFSRVPLDPDHYAVAIETCLTVNKLEDARAILSLMRDHEIVPTSDSLQKFAFAYAKAAIRAAKKNPTNTKGSGTIAVSRAQSAYKICNALQEVTPTVLSKVAQACSKTAQWTMAKSILQETHRNLLATKTPLKRNEIELVRGMHSHLIRDCATFGNVTAALSFANDIQNFARLSRGINEEARSVSRECEEQPPDGDDDSSHFLSSIMELQPSSYSAFVGMRPEDWVSLIKAASHSGHWKVCVNALQYLRRHVQGTDPRNNQEDIELLDGRYDQLVPALTATCICLEKRSQYAWSERVIRDWIKWSGRRPRPEAILATTRILSTRGYGEEIKRLLADCIDFDTVSTTKYTKKDVGYEEMLYIGAITALHNNGLYDDADEVFMTAISKNHLPFVFGEHEGSGSYVLDLHGMNVAVAHSAVRVALRRLVSETSAKGGNLGPRNMMIITGRGRNSALRMRPVLRPEVQRMLLEEFYPPLNTISVPGNTGALMVYDVDISAWQAHQKEQKGARMLTLAALLKNASTDRVKFIASKLGSGEKTD